MTRYIAPVLFAALTTPAVAAAPSSIQDASQTVLLELVGKSRQYSDMSEYDIAVDGSQVTVVIGAKPGNGQVALYDEFGDLVVGYRFSGKHMIIYDDDGLVAYGAPDEVGLGVIEEYGTASMLLTDPAFLAQFVQHNVELEPGATQDAVVWNSILSATEMLSLSCVDASMSPVSEHGASNYEFGWECPSRQ